MRLELISLDSRSSPGSGFDPLTGAFNFVDNKKWLALVILLLIFLWFWNQVQNDASKIGQIITGLLLPIIWTIVYLFLGFSFWKWLLGLVVSFLFSKPLSQSLQPNDITVQPSQG